MTEVSLFLFFLSILHWKSNRKPRLWERGFFLVCSPDGLTFGRRRGGGHVSRVRLGLRRQGRDVRRVRRA